VLVGLSDAGAHVSQMCSASFPCYLLGYWVRERAEFSLEFGVWRLTGHLAEALGLRDRGRLAEGLAADICVFDPDTIDQGPARRVFDLPGGGDRLVRDATGIEHVLVNGTFIIRGGLAVDASPGQLLGASA
jgi:N-acyl-D-amino-acid deacylase